MSFLDALLPQLSQLGASLDGHFNRICDKLDKLNKSVENASDSPELSDLYVKVSTASLPASGTADIITAGVDELLQLIAYSSTEAQLQGTLSVNGVPFFDAGPGALITEPLPILPGEKLSVFNGSGGAATYYFVFKRIKIGEDIRAFKQGSDMEGLVNRTGPEHDGTRDVIDSGSALVRMS